MSISDTDIVIVLHPDDEGKWRGIAKSEEGKFYFNDIPEDDIQLAMDALNEMVKG